MQNIKNNALPVAHALNVLLATTSNYQVGIHAQIHRKIERKRTASDDHRTSITI